MHATSQITDIFTNTFDSYDDYQLSKNTPLHWALSNPQSFGDCLGKVEEPMTLGRQPMICHFNYIPKAFMQTVKRSLTPLDGPGFQFYARPMKDQTMHPF